MKTIWGQTQKQKKLAEGVYDVDTARHGGIIVADNVADKYLSAAAKEVADHAYGWWHFEEDCDWAVFAYENKGLCPSNWTDEMIMRSLENYNMGYLEKVKKGE